MPNLSDPEFNFGPNQTAVLDFLTEIDGLTAEQITAIGEAWQRWRELEETYLIGQDVFGQNLRAAAQVAARHEAWEHVDQRCREIKYRGSSAGAEQGAREVASALVYQDLLPAATYALMVSFWRDGVGYEPTPEVPGYISKQSSV
jgi:hypothetical protein